MKIPKGRVRRSAKLGTALGGQAARLAGTKAASLTRSGDEAQERLEARHLETAIKMVDALGEMKGAAMKIGQLASFIDTEFLPPEYAEIYQEKLAQLRSSAPPMPWKTVVEVIEEEYEEPVGEHFAEFEPEAFAAASIGQVHRATLLDGREVAVKIQYPGVADALESDLRNAGMLVRLAKAIAPGLDAKSVARELRERVLEELDYEYEAQNQRSFSRAYRDHPFIYVPDVITRLSRRRVLVTEFVDGIGFEAVKELDHAERSRFGEIVFRFCFGSIYHLQHFNADSHPGNYLLMGDGRVAFLDFGMTKKLDREQIELEQRAIDAAIPQGPRGAAAGARRPRVRQEPVEARRGAPHGPRDAGRRLVHGGPRLPGLGAAGDEDHRVDLRPPLGVLRPDAAREPARRGADGQADGDRRRRGARAARREAQLAPDHARVGLRDAPETELGEQEWEYFETRGIKRVPGIAAPASGAQATRIRRLGPGVVGRASAVSARVAGPDAPDRDDQPDQRDRCDDPEADLDPGHERVLDDVEELVGDGAAEVVEGRRAGLGAGEDAVDDSGLLAGHPQPERRAVADHRVLGAAREDRRRQPEADGTAGDLEHVGDPPGEARARGIEHRHSGGRDRGVEETGADPGQGEAGDQRRVAGVTAEERDHERPGGEQRGSGDDHRRPPIRS